MARHIETDITFREGDYYTSFQFEQLEYPEDLRLVLTDYDGADQVVDCTLELDEWEYVAKRILEMVAYQRQVIDNNTPRVK